MGSKSFIFHFNPVPLLIWEKKKKTIFINMPLLLHTYLQPAITLVRYLNSSFHRKGYLAEEIQENRKRKL